MNVSPSDAAPNGERQWSCTTCGALVAESWVRFHREWHAATETFR